MAASNRLCIKDNKIINIIYADDSFVTLLNQTSNFDSILNSSDYSNKTYDIGYTFDGNNFNPPVLAQLDIQTIVAIKVQKSILGFNNLMVQYATQNILAGISQAGKTKLIADTLDDVMRYGQSGSLYQAIAALQAITLTQNMDPYLNQTVINNLIAQTQAVLASL